MSKCLVTGGAGFIGSHVARELLQRDHSVLVLDDLSGGFPENIPAGAQFIQGDITEALPLQHLFEINKFEYVFHLAAYAAEGLSHFIKRFNYNNNLIGSVNLINASVNFDVKCFVFTSSIAVYGASQLPMTEEMTPTPEDSYGIAKYAVEQELEASHAMFGLNHVIFRPHNVYGEFQNIGDKYRNVIGIFMNQLMQDLPMTVFGDGSQSRAFSYIGDIAPLIAKSAEMPAVYNQVFNIGADTPYSVNTLVQVVAQAMEKEANIKYLPARNEVLHAYSSHEKVRKFFGEHPSTPLETGIRRMADWARQVGVRQSKKFENIEIMKNFPKGWL